MQILTQSPYTQPGSLLNLPADSNIAYGLQSDANNVTSNQ